MCTPNAQLALKYNELWTYVYWTVKVIRNGSFSQRLLSRYKLLIRDVNKQQHAPCTIFWISRVGFFHIKVRLLWILTAHRPGALTFDWSSVCCRWFGLRESCRQMWLIWLMVLIVTRERSAQRSIIELQCLGDVSGNLCWMRFSSTSHPVVYPTSHVHDLTILLLYE